MDSFISIGHLQGEEDRAIIKITPAGTVSIAIDATEKELRQAATNLAGQWYQTQARLQRAEAVIDRLITPTQLYP